MSKALLILGMHRSGTSALAGTLRLAGLDLGPNLTPGRDDNPRGFFEHDEIWRVHHTLLQALGSDWHDIRCLPAGWQQSDAAKRAVLDLGAILRRDFLCSDLWGAKDPRASRLFDLWPGLAQSMGMDLRVVLALRHPFESARSLARRDGVSEAHGLALWLRYTLEAERATRFQPRAIQPYQNLLANWQQELDRLDSVLELRLPARTSEQNTDIADFLDVGLWHQKACEDWTGGEDTGPVSSWCADAYAAMLTFPNATVAETLDAIAGQFDEWERQANALCAQVAYQLTQQNHQDKAIRWLEGERDLLIKTVRSLEQERRRLAEDRSEELVLAGTVRSLEEERGRLIEDRRREVADHEARRLMLTETIRSLEEERSRLVEDRRREVADHEAQRLLQAETIRSLETERCRLIEDRRKELADFQERHHYQAEVIRSLMHERDRLAEKVRSEEMRRSSTEADLSTANRRVEQLEIDAGHLRSALDAMYRSRSWRVTAPMRGVTRLFVERVGNGSDTVTETCEAGPAAGEPSVAIEYSNTASVVLGLPEATNLSEPMPRPSATRTLDDRLRILIVTPDIHGPVRNGGIGTAFSALAISFVRWGYEVSILYALGDYTESEPVAYWREYYSAVGVNLIPLEAQTLDMKPELQGSLYSQSAWKVHCWLKTREQDFDLAVFPEWMGLAYYVLISKGHNLAYGDLTIAVNAHSPENWALQGNRALPDSPDMLDREFMERETVRRADWLISPSVYMFDWMQKHQWQLPAQRDVIQNLLSECSFQDERAEGDPAVRELVFFGRLEFRKGMKLFCDAIDRLSATQLRELERVTFMGKGSQVKGLASAEYIRMRSHGWSIPVDIYTDRNREEALSYLARPGVLAVIASLSENSPYTVLECLHHRVCFLATTVGGIPELVHPDDRDRSLFDPTPTSLAQKLADALQEGTAPARMAQSQEQTRALWSAWLERIAQARRAEGLTAVGGTREASPLISVCLVHHNRPALLAQALDSLRAQTYPNFEIVLVDDGSPSAEAQAFLDALEPEFASRGWQIIRQPNRYLGAARNRAAEASRGSYLLFMDDDNVAMPNELEVFVKAALNSRADILTCVAQLFQGDRPPAKPEKIWLPLGGALGPGLFRNVFGDANALWKRDVFLRAGGYTTDHGVGHEDWELFAEAIFRGFRLEIVPEPLFWYRIHASSMLRTGDIWADHARSVRPYIRHDPSGLGLASAYAVCLLQSRVVSLNVDDLNAQIAEWRSHAYVPVMGHVKIRRVYEPPFPDGWVGRSVSLLIEPRKPILGLQLSGWRPDDSEDEIEITLRLHDQSSSKRIGGGTFAVNLSFNQPVSAGGILSIEASAVRQASGVDGRMISFILDDIEVTH